MKKETTPESYLLARWSELAEKHREAELYLYSEAHLLRARSMYEGFVHDFTYRRYLRLDRRRAEYGEQGMLFRVVPRSARKHYRQERAFAFLFAAAEAHYLSFARAHNSILDANIRDVDYFRGRFKPSRVTAGEEWALSFFHPEKKNRATLRAQEIVNGFVLS